MSIKTKALFITFLSIGILALLAYGYISSQKLDAKKEKAVQSNIKDFLYDEAADTLDIDNPEMEEDIDGEEVVDEDDDFEVYEEPEPENEAEAEAEPESTASQKPTASPNTESPTGSYYVIVGTFKSKSNAERKVKQLEEKAIQGFITQLGTSKLHAAVAGQFQTEKEAKAFLAKIKKEHSIEGIVRKLD